ncbi:MAG: hypothetical protein J6331_09955, partial [Lentisphaeria bacterium]|nr:hypothetical protein [Lentisphaeria bacterium]
MKKFFLLSSLLFVALFASAAENPIVVRTFPDGYKDNGKGSIFSDAPSVLILYTWAAEKPFTGKEVKILLTLPESL